jgi:hypothetical protein
VPLLAPRDVVVATDVGAGVSVGVDETVGVDVGVGLISGVAALTKPATEFTNASWESPLARRSSVMHSGWPGTSDSLEPVSTGTVFRLTAIPPFDGLATGIAQTV